jgi:prepilin-type processing-associated H-X9-DG protein
MPLELLQDLHNGGDITFYAADGTTPSFVYDESAGLTINEAGADRDFRVESDGNANMLFVDGGANSRCGTTRQPQRS